MDDLITIAPLPFVAVPTRLLRLYVWLIPRWRVVEWILPWPGHPTTFTLRGPRCICWIYFTWRLQLLRYLHVTHIYVHVLFPLIHGWLDGYVVGTFDFVRHLRWLVTDLLGWLLPPG